MEAINLSSPSVNISEEYQKENNYVGINEDKEWIKNIEKCASEEIYNKLVQFVEYSDGKMLMDSVEHYQGLQHIQPRYKNIKELVKFTI